MPNWCNLNLEGHIGKVKEADKYIDFSVAFNPGKKEDNKPAVWFNCRAVGKAKTALEGVEKGKGVVIVKAAAEGWKDNNGNDRITWIVFDAHVWVPKGDNAAPPPFEPDDDSIPF